MPMTSYLRQAAAVSTISSMAGIPNCLTPSSRNRRRGPPAFSRRRAAPHAASRISPADIPCARRKMVGEQNTSA